MQRGIMVPFTNETARAKGSKVRRDLRMRLRFQRVQCESRSRTIEGRQRSPVLVRVMH